MSFRNPLRRLSQLAADTLTGAIVQTSDGSEDIPRAVMQTFRNAANQIVAGLELMSGNAETSAKIYGAGNRRIKIENAIWLAGDPLAGIEFGADTIATSNGAGLVSIPHNLGAVPDAVYAGAVTTTLYTMVWRTAATSSANIGITVTRLDGTAIPTGTNIPITWIACLRG